VRNRTRRPSQQTQSNVGLCSGSGLSSVLQESGKVDIVKLSDVEVTQLHTNEQSVKSVV